MSESTGHGSPGGHHLQQAADAQAGDLAEWNAIAHRCFLKLSFSDSRRLQELENFDSRVLDDLIKRLAQVLIYCANHLRVASVAGAAGAAVLWTPWYSAGIAGVHGPVAFLWLVGVRPPLNGAGDQPGQEHGDGWWPG